MQPCHTRLSIPASRGYCRGHMGRLYVRAPARHTCWGGSLPFLLPSGPQETAPRRLIFSPHYKEGGLLSMRGKA